MKAVRAHEVGGPEVLRYENVPELTPGPGEALVDIKAIGVNYTDVSSRKGTNPPASLPWTPGREAAGLVKAVGQGVAAAVEKIRRWRIAQLVDHRLHHPGAVAVNGGHLRAVLPAGVRRQPGDGAPDGLVGAARRFDGVGDEFLLPGGASGRPGRGTGVPCAGGGDDGMDLAGGRSGTHRRGADIRRRFDGLPLGGRGLLWPVAAGCAFFGAVARKQLRKYLSGLKYRPNSGRRLKIFFLDLDFAIAKYQAEAV